MVALQTTTNPNPDPTPGDAAAQGWACNRTWIPDALGLSGRRPFRQPGRYQQALVPIPNPESRIPNHESRTTNPVLPAIRSRSRSRARNTAGVV